MIFFTSSSGTWNLRSKSLALFNDKRRKSASVPVTVLLGCASCSSLLCYEKKINSSIIVVCCYTYSGLVWHSDIAEAFAASSRVCRSSQLQKTLILHGLDVRSSCVPWGNFDLVVHLQLHFLVISILLRSEEEFFSVTSILVNLQPSVS
jgi:hypothetical protein